jgi:transcriptional regulator GlxA family with amidase domain
MRSANRSKREPERTPARRRIVFLAFPNTVLLDLAGPWDVFNGANLFAGLAQKPYALELVSVTGDIRIETAGGPPLVGGRSAGSCRGPIDTLVVPAALGLEGGVADRAGDRSGLGHLRRLARASRRVVSVCGGTFILAAAGLLDGLRVTTHWRYCDDLARKYPGLTVEPDQIFVRDGSTYTSAGVTAGMDLALALVEEDLGRALALTVARDLVMFVRRSGGQTQYSTALESQQAERDSLRDLLAWAVDHLEQDLSVEAMARKAHMSPRNFSRVFGREVGETPARHVERLRVDAARQQLEESESDYGDVARRCGFGSVNSMRRSFLRVLKVTPSDYRKRFRVDQ